MRVAIAGAHGKIALHLASLLSEGGDEVIGLIRNPNHADEVRAHGAEPVRCDLEQTDVSAVAEAIKGADAAVFAAGAGPGSGAQRKLTVDRDGAIKLLEACRGAGVSRYLVISSIGAENPPAGDEVFAVYLRAKAAADAAVQESELEWIVLRPGRLTDDAPTGKVQLQPDPFRAEVPRADVAAVIAALLREPRATGLTLYLNTGAQPVDKAVEAVLG